MKIIISFLTLVSFIVFLSSCRKDNSSGPVFNDSIPKIKTVTEYWNEAKVRVTSFSYDTSSRLVKILFNEIYNDQQYYDTLIYNGSTVTKITYNSQNKLLEQQVFTLNSNHLAVLMTDTLGDQKKSALRYFLNFNLMEHEANIFGYDANGSQTLEISTNEYGGTHRFDKSYSDGNLVSSSFTFMAQDTLIQTGVSSFKYYTDKTNTIGNLNRGIPFLGKQNTNLQLSISETKWHSTDTLRINTSYRYEFDNKNRVIRQYINPQNSENEDVTYLSFTYR